MVTVVDAGQVVPVGQRTGDVALGPEPLKGLGKEGEYVDLHEPLNPQSLSTNTIRCLYPERFEILRT